MNVDTKPATKAPMPAMKVMKSVRAKKKRVSKVAKGRLAKYLVVKGTKEKTVSGLTKDDFVRNKAALGKKFDRVKGWREAVMKARAVMGMRGFVAMNGRTAQGKALYAKTKSFYSP